jgi:hypothetical protein
VINAVSATTPSVEAAPVSKSSQQQQGAPPPTQSKPPAHTEDSATLSSAAQAALAALKEAAETPAQTAKEASNGDKQAKQLLAKESAPRQQTKYRPHVVTRLART